MEAKDLNLCQRYRCFLQLALTVPSPDRQIKEGFLQMSQIVNCMLYHCMREQMPQPKAEI